MSQAIQKQYATSKLTIANQNTSAATAKLSQKVLFQLANGTTDISKNALHFMLYTINFVAKDGRIYASFEQIKKELQFQTKTLVRVIKELKGLNLLSKQGDFYYSHFHILAGRTKTDEIYVRNLSVFTSPIVMNLKKNELRFLLYVASRGLINASFKRSAVETLYSNATHKGVNYIDSYNTLADILNKLVSLGFVDVMVEGQIFNDKNVHTFLPTFHTYCGYKESTRKKRMSKHKEKTHVIGFRINPVLFSDENIRSNESARKEIEYFADENGFFHSQMRPNTIPTFIKSVQDEVFNRFGIAGYQLYREALISYFEKEGDNVIYHDLYADEKSSKAVNAMVDFFLLPAVKDLIVTCATTMYSEDSKTTYFKQEDNLANLVDYYIEAGSDNHIILLEEALEAANISLNELVKVIPITNPNENSWLLLQLKANYIYKTIRYKENVLSASCQKLIVREWAKNGLLSQKQKLNAAVDMLKKKVVFFNIKDYTELNSTNVQTKVAKSKTKSVTKKDPSNVSNPDYFKNNPELAKLLGNNDALNI